MKKLKSYISFALAAIMTMTLFTVCFVSSADTEDTDKRAALLAWYDANVSDETDDSTFEYSLCCSVDTAEFYRVGPVDSIYAGVLVDEQLGDVVVVYPNTASYVVYKEGQVYSFSDAYNSGILSKDILL